MQKGQINQANGIFSEMKRHHVAPNDTSRCLFVDALLDSEQVDAAISYIRSIQVFFSFSSSFIRSFIIVPFFLFVHFLSLLIFLFFLSSNAFSLFHPFFSSDPFRSFSSPKHCINSECRRKRRAKCIRSKQHHNETLLRQNSEILRKSRGY